MKNNIYLSIAYTLHNIKIKNVLSKPLFYFSAFVLLTGCSKTTDHLGIRVEKIQIKKKKEITHPLFDMRTGMKHILHNLQEREADMQQLIDQLPERKSVALKRRLMQWDRYLLTDNPWGDERRKQYILQLQDDLQLPNTEKTKIH